MDEYIKREALLVALDTAFDESPIEDTTAWMKGRRIVRTFPATDVQEVKHGKWVKGETDRQYCSICHEVRPYYFKETLSNRYAEQKKLSLINWECPYCPNCGAKMDEKDDEK